MKRFVYLLVGIASLWLVLGVGPTRGAVINFDDVHIGGGVQPIAGDRYKNYGVLLSAAPGGLDVWYAPDYANTRPNTLGTSEHSEDIIIQFVLPGTTAPGAPDVVSFYTTGQSSFTWSVRAYDLAGQLLDSQTAAGPVLVSFSHAIPDVHEIVVSPVVGYGGIDTLAFDTIVPEPSTIGLLALGATALLHPHRGRVEASVMSQGETV